MSVAIVELPRLLAARSEFGYTAIDAQAMSEEPEAVSADEQLAQTRVAQYRARARVLDEWSALHEQGHAFLDALRRSSFANEHESEIRALARQLARLDQRVVR